jgi:hypothetical protein
MAGKGRASFQGWALVAILLLGFALRLHRLGADSLWYDETVSVHLAAKSIPALVAHTAGDIHPPGYYLLLHVWVRLAGLSEFATAYLSLFFGLVLVALAYRLAARFFDWRVPSWWQFPPTIYGTRRKCGCTPWEPPWALASLPSCSRWLLNLTGCRPGPGWPCTPSLAL